MDVIFGKMLEVPMYQNVKVKCEPLSNTNNQSTTETVSVTYYSSYYVCICIICIY